MNMVCDRCGMPIKVPAHPIYKLSKLSPLAPETKMGIYYPDHEADNGYAPVYLCDDCSQSFVEWWDAEG